MAVIYIGILWTIWLFCKVYAIEPNVGVISSDLHAIGGPSRLQDALDDEFLILNGEFTSLRELYSDNLPTIDNFRIGRHLLQSIFNDDEFMSPTPSRPDWECPGQVYVERELLYRKQLPVPELSFSSMEIRGTPSTIVTEIMKTIETKSPPVTLLMGIGRSGKTILLHKMQYEIYLQKRTNWMIYIDLRRTFTSLRHRLTFVEFIDKCVYPQLQTLFYNLLDINPKKIIFFIDSFDKMSYDSGQQIIPIIKTLADKGVVIIVAGNVNTMKYLTESSVDLNTWEITDTKLTETKQFLINAWKNPIKIQLMDSPLLEKWDIITERLDDYASIAASMLHKTPMPRQPLFLNLHAWIFLETFSISCMTYALRETTATTIINNLRIYRMNKMTLYGNFVTVLERHRQNFGIEDEVYGVVALERILRRIEGLRIASILLQSMETSLRQAKTLLQLGRRDHVVIKYITDNDIIFIHPDFENYYAALFIKKCFVNLNVVENKGLIFLLQHIFSTRSYGRLLEFLNIEGFFQLNSPELRLLVMSAGKMKSLILDNLLLHGCDQLLQVVIEQYIADKKFSELKEYFSHEYRPNFRVKHMLGMIESIDPQESNFEIFEDPASISLPNRRELLIEKSMTHIVDILKDCGITDELTIADYQGLLDFSLKKSVLPYNLVIKFQEIMGKVTTSNSHNNLLYRIINEVSDVDIDFLKKICRLGFDPKNIVLNGQTLLHAAAKWNRIDLLHIIVNDFGVTGSDLNGNLDPTLLKIALDSNPSPLYTPPGWWRKMSFLVEFIKSPTYPITALYDLMNIESFKDGVKTLRISLEDCKSPWFKLMLGSTSAHLSPINNDVLTMAFHPIDVNDDLYERYTVAIRSTPPASWGLNPQTLSLRRTFLLKSLHQYGFDISLLELFVHYRGVDPLSSQDREFYRKTIKLLIDIEQKSLNDITRNRILNTLFDNIGDINDLHDVDYFARNGLLKTTDIKVIRSILQSKLQERLIKARKGQSLTRKVLSVNERLLQSRVNYNPEIFNLEKFEIQARMLIGFRKQPETLEMDFSALECLSE